MRFSPPYPPASSSETLAVPFETMSYPDKIMYLDRGTQSLMVVTLIRGTGPFRQLSAQGAAHTGNCLRFLAGAGYPARQKDIAVLSMQDLDLAGYLNCLGRIWVRGSRPFQRPI